MKIILSFAFIIYSLEKIDSLTEEDYINCNKNIPDKNGFIKCTNVQPKGSTILQKQYKCCYFHYSINDKFKTGCTFIKNDIKDITKFEKALEKEFQDVVINCSEKYLYFYYITLLLIIFIF